MFTGIITHLGILKSISNFSFTFEAPLSFSRKLNSGISISVNGVCLTLVGKPTQKSFLVELMPETLKRSSFGLLKKGNIVNLELPVTPTTFLSGHIVQGHVDGIGLIKKISLEGNSHILTISAPKALRKYIVSKGAIAINGVSLTVVQTLNHIFTVGIISYTWEHTMFHTLKTSDQLNLEVDILAKYICQKI